jgi:hypothetical protein
MMYLITNRLPSSLIIEDIGVRLAAAGGTSSSKLLSEHTYNASHQIKEYERKKWVMIEIRQPVAKAPVPLWPFSAAPQAPVPPPPPPAESVMLNKVMDRLEGMIGSLQKASIPSPSAIYQSAAAIPAPIAHPQASADPMFIPKQIMPEVADVNINVKTSESETKDFDSGLEALKKARKK